MSSNNSSSNRINVPQAKQARNKFKMRSANEVGVDLKNGYNGDLGKARWSRKCVPYTLRPTSGTAAPPRDIGKKRPT